jgi:type III secretion system FlhB-like substrate exporter
MKNTKNKYYKNAVLAYGNNRQNMGHRKISESDNIANSIIKRAIEHSGPVRNNPDLLATIARLNSGGGMPERVYSAVGEILDFLYLSDKKAYNKLNNGVKSA